MNTIVIIMGSEADRPHAETIIEGLKACEDFDFSSCSLNVYTASAHKEPLKVLGILDTHKHVRRLVYITIAGRSNALSGFCAANCSQPVIACPPFSDKIDMLTNINSTLQMPSRTPVMTVIDPGNAARAAVRILSVASDEPAARQEK